MIVEYLLWNISDSINVSGHAGGIETAWIIHDSGFPLDATCFPKYLTVMLLGWLIDVHSCIFTYIRLNHLHHGWISLEWSHSLIISSVPVEMIRKEQRKYIFWPGNRGKVDVIDRHCNIRRPRSTWPPSSLYGGECHNQYLSLIWHFFSLTNLRLFSEQHWKLFSWKLIALGSIWLSVVFLWSG